MKKTLYAIFTLLTYVTFAFVPNSFAQDAAPASVVRVIYFLPNDRQSQPNIDTQLDTLMKETRKFYADTMGSYGFDRKTFQLETDANGNVVVHHVKGEFNDTYYHSGTFGKVIDELSSEFDTGNNIYFVAIDISSEKFDANRPNSHICGLSSGKWAATPASGVCFNYRVIAHELGHNFGLSHDHFNYSGTDAMVDSFCSAEWLDVHPYFNEGSQTDFNATTTVNMLPPSRAPSSNAIRFSFEVRDADGLHQAQLYIPALDSVVDCKRLNSKSATVAFDTTYVVSEVTFIWLKVIDVNGNHTDHGFPTDISNFLLPPKKVTIPDANLADAIRVHTNLSPTEEITTEAMVRLTHLFTSSDNPITDITGLEYAVNLVALSLYRQNTITDFSALSGLRELRFLELPGTGISDISVLSALTKLQILYLQNNTIQDISALAGLTNLKKLELNGNDISNITSLAGLTNLTYLDLRSNQISDVSPLVGLRNLNRLYLAGNPIADFSPLRILLAKNPNLEIDIDIPELPPLAFSPSTIADQTFEVGRSIQGLILPEATGGTAPYTYTLSPIPDGLAFDTRTRELNGAPTTLGTTEVAYTATDAVGASTPAPLTFMITVFETGPDPLDVNADGQVTVIDLALVALSYGTHVSDGVSLPADVNADGQVNILDLTAVAQAIDTEGGGGFDRLSLVEVEKALAAAAALDGTAEAPMRKRHGQVSIRDIAYHNVADALADAKHLGHGVPAVLKELLHLLTEMAEIPEATALLPNYPNPFNPETWIPYHLSKDADVILTIHDVRGSVVRELTLGHQVAAVYESRGRAAYWDGRNQHGEKVASGLYFYTLTAGDFTATRKLLIAK